MSYLFYIYLYALKKKKKIHLQFLIKYSMINFNKSDYFLSSVLIFVGNNIVYFFEDKMSLFPDGQVYVKRIWEIELSGRGGLGWLTSNSWKSKRRGVTYISNSLITCCIDRLV